MSVQEAAEIYGAALTETASAGSSACQVIGDDGSRRLLPLRRWLGPPDAVERQLLMRAAPAVLDIGCGAGRHLGWLRREGVPALGIDTTPAAVALARGHGRRVLWGSIFDPVPGAGTWGSALLLDGNIGIGGRPERLLARVHGLLEPGGTAFVELEPPGVPSRRLQIKLEGREEVSKWLPWAWVGIDDIEALAAAQGFDLAESWSAGQRSFARLRRTAWPAGQIPADALRGGVTGSQSPMQDNLSTWK